MRLWLLNLGVLYLRATDKLMKTQGNHGLGSPFRVSTSWVTFKCAALRGLLETLWLMIKPASQTRCTLGTDLVVGTEGRTEGLSVRHTLQVEHETEQKCEGVCRAA